MLKSLSRPANKTAKGKILNFDKKQIFPRCPVTVLRSLNCKDGDFHVMWITLLRTLTGHPVFSCKNCLYKIFLILREPISTTNNWHTSVNIVWKCWRLAFWEIFKTKSNFHPLLENLIESMIFPKAHFWRAQMKLNRTVCKMP